MKELKFTQQKIDDFRKLYDEFDDLSDEIIKYIREKRYERYLTGYTEIEDYGESVPAKTCLEIRIYKYDGAGEYDNSIWIEIPWEHVQNDTWREYFDDKVKEDIEKENARKQKEIENKEKQEYEQYLKLKQKFGNK